MQNKNFLIIGEVFTEVHLYADHEKQHILRLGGIFHNARALNAIGQKYSLAVIAPSYLKQSIDKYSDELKADNCFYLGDITNCPNVIMISDSTEAGDQGYIDLLRDQAEVNIDLDSLRMAIEHSEPTDIIIYPGKFKMIDILMVLKDYPCKIHVDFQYNTQQIEAFKSLELKLETVFVSTSSHLFNRDLTEPKTMLTNLFHRSITNSILLKENRGGSRLYSYKLNKWFSSPAFPTSTVHSVGIGDCFNSIYLSLIEGEHTINRALRTASYAASLYASTWNFDLFVSFMKNLKEIANDVENLKGTELAWENRRNIHVYIAGPDFPHIDTTWIDKLFSCLEYHNFSPHRPIKENGLILGNEPDSVHLDVYHNDLLLLDKCSILIAVILNDDPGTYVEIGWMAREGKPVILFDPYHKASNLFLKKTATEICHSLGEVIDEIFRLLGQKEGNNGQL